MKRGMRAGGLVWAACLAGACALAAAVAWGQGAGGVGGGLRVEGGGLGVEGGGLGVEGGGAGVEGGGAAEAFVGPPVIEVGAVTAEVAVVETVVTTNLVAVLRTNRVTRCERVVSTNATLVRFTVEIDGNQNPTRFTSVMSDGSVVVTAAGDVTALTNRAALSTFNRMLGEVVGRGRRVASTNAWWQARGRKGDRGVQRVWSGGVRLE